MMIHALLSLMLGAGPAAPAKDKKSDPILQDTWTIVTIEQDGIKEPRKKKQPRPDRVLIFQKDAFEVKHDGKVVKSGGYRIDTSKTPMTIDLVVEEGEGKGTTLLGIFEIDKENLKLCLDMKGKNRPAAFQTFPNTGHDLVSAQRERKAGVDPKDASVVFDKPWQMGSGFIAYNGKVYDKASLCIDPKTNLVLPKNAAIVERHDKVDEVQIFMEKRSSIHAHFVRGESVLDYRDRLGCAVKLEKGRLYIGTFGEFGFLEGSVGMKLVIVVPKNAEVELHEGLSGGYGGRGGSDRPANAINPTREDPRPPLTKTKKGPPACWLAPTMENGWHTIPTRPDVDRRVAGEAKKNRD